MIRSLAILSVALVSTSLRAEEFKNEKDETLYAMGAILGRKLTAARFSAKELELVKQGLLDAASGKKLRLEEKELEEWGPKIDTMLTKRATPEVEAERARGQAYADRAAKEPGATRSKSGLVRVPLVPGAGASPMATDLVKVSYQGTLIDGTVFDSSKAHGGPAEFHLNQVVPCWTEGVQQMKVGEKARLVCPAALAYGAAGRPPQIPGGATLVFEIELLSIGK